MIIQQRFPVQGMTCENCAKHVEKALQALLGVSQTKVDFGQHQVTIQYDSATIPPNVLESTLKEAGYTLGNPLP